MTRTSVTTGARSLTVKIGTAMMMATASTRAMCSCGSWFVGQRVVARLFERRIEHRHRTHRHWPR
jgi:hypothetical protein